MNNNGRDALAWPPELWSGIDQAVHAEVDRTGIAGKVLPLRGPMPDATTVPADVIDEETMTVPDDAVLPVVELSVEFALTEAQVDAEASLRTGVTLATRAANLLAQAEDLLVFQGDGADDQAVFKRVKQRGSAGKGLLGAAASSVEVPAPNGHSGERTVDAVALAYGELQAKSQSGPYALILSPQQYAETFEPLPNTLVMPADRLRPLVTQGFFGTGALPKNSGLVVSVGGGTVDLVVGVEPAAAFLQVDGGGLYHFRVFERLALRLKDPEALVRLNFQD
jgi:uncharacterized linocin/CFP29 family protein